MEAIVGTYPDARAFNCSFGSYDTLASCQPVDRRERLINLRDLDNIIFARAVLEVIAGGISRPGVVPSAPYPEHYGDPAWQLSSWAMGFNTADVWCLCATTITSRNREDHGIRKDILLRSL